MGRVVVVNFITIDGVIQSPLSPTEDRDGGFEHGGWVPPYSDDTVNAFMQEATVNAAGLLLGRRSFDILADAWATADDSDPAVAAMNRMPKYVISSTRSTFSWQNSRSIGSDVHRAVTDLKSRTNGDLVVFGAGALVRALAEHDLVDQYRLLLFPMILGSGKRMFDQGSQPTTFTLTDSIVAASGVVILTYTRAAPT